MIRAVLDANVPVSSLIQPAGPSGRILKRLLEDRAFDLILSPPILDELHRCLRYPRIRKRFPESDDEIRL